MLSLMFLMFTVFNLFIIHKSTAEELWWAEISCACCQATAVAEEPAGTQGQPRHLWLFLSWALGSRTDHLDCTMEMLALVWAALLAGWCWDSAVGSTPPRDIASPTTQHGLETQAPPAAFLVHLPNLRQLFICERGEKWSYIYCIYIQVTICLHMTWPP